MYLMYFCVRIGRDSIIKEFSWGEMNGISVMWNWLMYVILVRYDFLLVMIGYDN